MTDTRQKLAIYYRQLHDSFPFFLKEVWRFRNLPTPSRVQYDVAKWLQHGPKRKGIRGFRGLSKTWITIAYIAWKLFNNPNERVLLVSASMGHSRKSLHMLRAWIDTVPFLQRLAPQKGSAQRDSGECFDVGPSDWDRTPSVTAVGITGQLPGIRATLIVPDDVETPENTITKDQRNLLEKRSEEFESILVPGGRPPLLAPANGSHLFVDLRRMVPGWACSFVNKFVNNPPLKQSRNQFRNQSRIQTQP